MEYHADQDLQQNGDPPGEREGHYAVSDTFGRLEREGCRLEVEGQSLFWQIPLRTYRFPESWVQGMVQECEDLSKGI